MEHQEEYTLSEEMPLAEAIAREEYKFPILLQTCGNKQFDSRPDYEDQTLPLDTLMLVERHAVLQFAHLKVLQVENDDETISDKGAEFALEYNGFVDTEILIPITYPGTVNIVHPPKRRRRYAEVSQVIADLPRLVRVELDTKTTPPADNGNVRTVKKGTILEITNVIKRDGESFAYLESSTKDNTKYLFREDTLVNFTAIPDTAKYTLPNVVTSMLLPKVVHFFNEPPIEDAISSSGTWRNNALVMTYGPMQLLDSQVKEFYVCWLRDPTIDVCIESGKRNFKVALIPSSRWETETVKLLNVHVPENRYAFLERKFPLTLNSEFVENKLYIVRPYLNLVTCLNSKVAMEEDKKQECIVPLTGAEEPNHSNDMLPKYLTPAVEKWLGSACTPRQRVKAEPSSDDDDTDDYEIPAPPIPERRPTARHKSVPHTELPSQPSKETPKLRTEILRKITEKTKLGFGHVHKELIHIFSNDKRKGPPRPKLKKSHSTSTEEEHEKPGRPQLKRSETDVGKLKPNLRKKSESQKKGLSHSKSISSRRPLPAIPTPGAEDQDSSLYDSPDMVDDSPVFIESRQTKEKYSYEKLSLENEIVIMKPNQTTQDFCNYSVKQVAECFRLCALDELGEKCEDALIDGAFLASFDLQELKNEPFFLTEFKVRKVKLIVHDGWRPTYDTIKHK